MRASTSTTERPGGLQSRNAFVLGRAQARAGAARRSDKAEPERRTAMTRLATRTLLPAAGALVFFALTAAVSFGGLLTRVGRTIQRAGRSLGI